MVIWKGYGILIVPIVLICAGAVYVIGMTLGAVLFNGSGVDSVGWLLAAVTLSLSAAVVRYLGNYLDKAAIRELYDPETDEIVILQSENSLYFIKIRYWPIVLLALAILAALVQLTLWLLSLPA
jgi:hypothetical protein